MIFANSSDYDNVLERERKRLACAGHSRFQIKCGDLNVASKVWARHPNEDSPVSRIVFSPEHIPDPACVRGYLIIRRSGDRQGSHRDPHCRPSDTGAALRGMWPAERPALSPPQTVPPLGGAGQRGP